MSLSQAGHSVRRQIRVEAWAARWRAAKEITGVVYEEIFRTRVFDVAGGLSFFFLFSLIPLLMVSAVVLSLLPIPNLFQQLLSMLATVVPPDSLSMVEQIVAGILSPRHNHLLSFGIIGYLWTSTGAFTSLISSLNIAYDVRTDRPWWRDRLQAFLLTCTSGLLAFISLIAIVAGPHFGHFLHDFFGVPRSFALLWPTIRLGAIFVTFVAGLEIVYLLGPNRRQKFSESIPGAVLAIAVWFLASAGLDFYLDHIAHYNAMYGSLAALIGLMLWLYITSVIVLIGAELNAELSKRKRRRESLVLAGHHSEQAAGGRSVPTQPAA